MVLEGRYTRKRDGVTCSYRAECTEWGADVTWNARVFVSECLIGEPSGKLLLVPLSAADLEHAIRHAIEAAIESSHAIQGVGRQ
ncbi:MAG TPA: hypothetical protein VEI29_06105 [Burkholderiaceae bacterium]|nr:hypothetical protein [Burkholderiaceae bacterium]